MGTIEDSNPPEAKVVGNYSDPLAKSQPTAQEFGDDAKRIAAKMFVGATTLGEIESDILEVATRAERRGRAEGEYVGSLLHQTCPTTKDIEAEITNLRAKLAAAEQERDRLTISLRDTVAALEKEQDANLAAEQREKRLREAASEFSEACEWIDRQLLAYSLSGAPLPNELAYDAGSSRVEWRRRFAPLRAALAEGESR